MVIFEGSMIGRLSALTVFANTLTEIEENKCKGIMTCTAFADTDALKSAVEDLRV